MDYIVKGMQMVLAKRVVLSQDEIQEGDMMSDRIGAADLETN